MKVHALLMMLGSALAGCDAPLRDVSYFEAHADEARRVLNNCEAGGPGRECDNARAAIGRLIAKARKEQYRQGFE